MAISRICIKSFCSTLAGYVPQSKALRVALPILAAAGAAAIYYLWNRATTKTPSKPTTISPLMPDYSSMSGDLYKAPEAKDRNVFFRDQAPSNPNTVVYVGPETYPANWIRLSKLYTGVGTSLDYIVAEQPPELDWKYSYYQMVNNEAGFVISFGDSKFYAVKGERVKFDLKCLDELQIFPDCYGYKYEVSRDYKKEIVWHLHFKDFNPGYSFKEVQDRVDQVNAFIKEKGIQLNDRPIITSCKNGMSQSGLFVLFHQMDHHLSLLIDKTLKDNPVFSNDQIADAILKDYHFPTTLYRRSRIIENKSIVGLNNESTYAMYYNFTGKGRVSDEEINQAYRKHVIAKIQEVKSSSAQIMS